MVPIFSQFISDSIELCCRNPPKKDTCNLRPWQPSQSKPRPLFPSAWGDGSATPADKELCFCLQKVTFKSNVNQTQRNWRLCIYQLFIDSASREKNSFVFYFMSVVNLNLRHACMNNVHYSHVIHTHAHTHNVRKCLKRHLSVMV